MAASPTEPARDQLTTLQRQLDREKRYNADLIRENDELKAELARYRSAPTSKTDAATQTGLDAEISTSSAVVAGESEWTAHAVEQGESVASSVKAFLSAKHSEIERKDFVFNEGLGMYYNATNGMMFDGKRYLYYDYAKNVYLYYDEQSGEYKEDPSRNGKTQPSRKRKLPRDMSVVSDSSSEEEEGEVVEDGVKDTDSDICAPCIRIVVFRSNILTPGDLSIATCDRTFSIGRDSKRELVLNEDAVSKYHALISFDMETGCYSVQDYGSQNGTQVNGTRLSASKVVSEKRTLEHLDVLIIGSTSLVCHIHDKDETCDHCEPGIARELLQNVQPQKSEVVENIISRVTENTLKDLHRQQIVQIKRKYGLQKDHYISSSSCSSSGTSASTDYVDRSRVRRAVVGSDHPSLERPTVEASVHVPIPTENKGYQMLSKMGWQDGEGLNSSRNTDSITQPLAPQIRLNETAGLGAELPSESLSMSDVTQRQKKEKWAKAAKRYQGLPTVNVPEKVAAILPGAARSGNIAWVRGETMNVDPEATEINGNTEASPAKSTDKKIYFF
ncbi:angiogenic factor with G patch and FHA domains 1-like [Paramacrobiotus metropolitanus]|uniref:angiogenic factor with G patch and FHA domains 1-like n=1 Tax=Paramacrobiotus metropolitanus TaxID=2943436 RepID=UPI0024459A16|nr:angiogenic factor with G patch and FHA domains 1-like [Paramacrobiotus metropolitanus]XP_055330019.1 angiogenic factor with G patch and FHA domains 1-like [Paramacrobiotus metropolitanus]XP_055330020.1 angiogenic factor with G patch and FHA domains 1-like [Paramacrobiotus metropolitanus]XP_055330021.1 angiogenic factor with G patch and FHA domains 1-like [Paramacrobiotus metropolitanus]